VETTGDVRASSVFFQRISVALVQRFNSVLLHDGFVGDHWPEWGALLNNLSFSRQFLSHRGFPIIIIIQFIHRHLQAPEKTASNRSADRPRSEMDVHLLMFPLSMGAVSRGYYTDTPRTDCFGGIGREEDLFNIKHQNGFITDLNVS